jgi:YD repeat-containing protein
MASAPACVLLEKRVNRRVSERFPKDDNDSGNHRTERNYAFDKTHKVDRYVDGRGVETTFGRDGVERVTGKTFTVPEGHPEIQDVPDVSYSFDANGNLTGIANADGSAGWGYDNLDRLTTEQDK